MPDRRLTLVASDVAAIGGMERVAYELARRLLERGWELTVIARSCTLPPGPRLRYLRMLAPSRPVSLALAASWVHGSWLVHRHRAGLLQTNNPVLANHVDIVHAHFSERAYRRRVGISRSRRPTLAYRLNSWIAAGLELASEHWSYRPGHTRRIVCVSQGLAREVAEGYPGAADTVMTIANGVDWHEFSPSAAERDTRRAELGLGADDLLAVFVGGDWRRKGLGEAIEGVARVEGWHLAVLGAGDAEEFGRLAAARGAAGHVHLLGVRRPHGWYAAADALVLPSRYEAFSLVMLEAAAAGLPLIVPRINGSEELVENGVTGWFTERNGIAIAARLSELAGDPERHGQMRRAAREAARQYDWERVVDRFEALYAELAATPG